MADGTYYCNYYWLASPSAYKETSTGLTYVACWGKVGDDYSGNEQMGLRPVVALNSGVTVDISD